MSRVGIAVAEDRYGTVAGPLRLIEPDVSPGAIRDRRVVVKPNLVSSSVQLASVHLDAVRAVIDFLQAFGPQRIIVAESSATGTLKAFETFGYRRLEAEYPNVELLDLGEDSYDAVTFETLDGAGKQVRVSRTVKECDFRVSLANAKTHDHVVCTLTLKNLLGCVPRGEQVWAHGAAVEPSEPLETVLRSNWLLAKNLVTLASQVKPDLGVIDGFLGMEGDGPISGSPVNLGVAVASSDFVAADAVMTSIMGFSPQRISYLYLAERRGLGNGHLRNLKTLGEDPKRLRRPFRPHSNYVRTQTKWRRFAKREQGGEV